MDSKVTVIFLPSGKKNPSAEALFQKDERIEKILFAEEGDPGSAWNRMLKKSDSDFVLFLSDAVTGLKDDFLSRMLAAFSDEKTAAVSGRVIPAEKQASVKTAFQRFRYGTERKEYDLSTLCLNGMRNFLLFNDCMMYKKTALQENGLFEPECLISPEILKAAELIYAGYRIVYEPAASVTAGTADMFADTFRKAFAFGAAERVYIPVFGLNFEMVFSSDAQHTYPVIQQDMRDFYKERGKAAAGELLKKGRILSAPFVRMQAGVLSFADFIGKRYHRLTVPMNRFFSGNRQFFG